MLPAEQAAERLREAYSGKAIAPLRDLIGPVDADAAYEVQRINTRFWQGQGRRIVGRKIGLTASAVQKQLGVDRPDFGVLFQDMEIPNGGVLEPAKVIQPKAEAEIGLKLRHLRLLLALDECGTITGAASILGISQVAASKALADLEAGINSKLFERLRGGLQPTEACLRLLESGRRIMGEIKVLGEEFMMLDQGLKGRVRIGVQTQSSQPFLARTTVAFKRAYPLITVEFVSASMLDLANELARSELQFVIGQHSLAGLHPSLMTQEIPSEPIVVVRGTQSGSEQQDATTLAELMEYPWCLPPRGTPLRLHLDHVLASQQLAAPRVLVEMSGTMLAEAIIHLSDFVALMPHSVAQEWAARGLVRVFSIELPPLPNPINLIWSEQTPMSQVAKLFLSFVRKQLAGGDAGEDSAAPTPAPAANSTRQIPRRV